MQTETTSVKEAGARRFLSGVIDMARRPCRAISLNEFSIGSLLMMEACSGILSDFGV